MDSPNSYISIDRRQALATNTPMPERMSGATLFADISGFTALSNALENEMGAKRGAEELTVHLNHVYAGLIGALHNMGGSVIGFSGDAITCWLDGDDGRRAIACALDMQQTMGEIGRIRTHSGQEVIIGIKVAVATGDVRRFVVGDPEHRLVDTMVGTTLDRVAAAESVAEKGDIVIDSPVYEQLEAHLNLVEWRLTDSGDRIAVIDACTLDVPAQPWPELAADAISPDDQYAYLLPAVFQRLNSGLGSFLAEFRPAVALFTRFVGLNFDQDEAARDKLDEFIRGVEGVLMRFGGSMIQLTVGDKGSYFYAAFGAPIAHENAAARAGNAAIAIANFANGLDYLEPLQIGLAQGRMRTGAYGSETRRTYGVLGSNVVLAARLMMVAQPGQILVSNAVQQMTQDAFRWETIENVKVKGFAKPVALARLVGMALRQRIQAFEPSYAIPMIGRQQELAQFGQIVERVQRGKGQIVGITGEAGMGKSRFAAEAIKLARDKGLLGLAGECQSYGTSTNYLPWQGVWRGFFDLDGAADVDQQSAELISQLTALNNAFLPRLPLLGTILNLALPENDLTASLDAKTRKTALESLLTDCLSLRAQTTPLLIVLEDCHWIDELSRELIGVIGRAIADLPVLLLVVYRPPDRQRMQPPPIDPLPHFNEMALGEFSEDETRQLVSLKLASEIGTDAVAPEELVQRISKRAAGNPFYIEELLNYLQALNIDVSDVAALDALELPSSIHSLILTRIDQLNESQQITMKVASVIGRLFQAAMVWGIYPELKVNEVELNLEVLSKVHLTPIEESEPELSYLFKHIMTQQVAYESLLYSTREMLHWQIGDYIERRYVEQLDQYTTLLAFHFERSNDEDKQRIYLRKAGDEAQHAYANSAAINYYNTLLPLLDEAEQVDVRLNLATVYESLGDWNSAESQAQTALTQAQAANDVAGIARAQIMLGEVQRKQGNFSEAADWFTQSLTISEENGHESGVAKALICTGTLNGQQGNFDTAQDFYERSLALRRKLNEQAEIPQLLNNMGVISRLKGEAGAAKNHYEEALVIERELKNRYLEAITLNNLGNVCVDLDDLEQASGYLAQAVAIQREIGNKWYLANALNNLGNVARSQKNAAAAMEAYTESLDVYQSLDDKWALAYLFEDVGQLNAQQSQAERAYQLVGVGQRLRNEVGSALSERERVKLDDALSEARESLGEQGVEIALEFGRNLTIEQAVQIANQTV